MGKEKISMATFDVRFPIAYSIEDYQKGQTYCLSRNFIDENAMDRMPAKIVKQKNNFTERHFEITKMMPSVLWLKPFLDMEKMVLIEKTVASGIASYSEFTLPAFSSLKMTTWSLYSENDAGNDTNYVAANIHKYLPDIPPVPKPSENNNCKQIDCITYPLQGAQYREEHDPKKNPSPVTNKIIDPNWLQSHPKNGGKLMRSHKIVTINVKVPLFQDKLVQMILNKGVIETVVRSHREVIFMEHIWGKMSKEEINDFQKKCHEESLKKGSN
ncbi:MAG: hypothetical protein MHMPM18_002129 [Marteilia pararefringens]